MDPKEFQVTCSLRLLVVITAPSFIKNALREREGERREGEGDGGKKGGRVSIMVGERLF